jgi:uncharacterized protein with von Willebrand factor type A (vWA) domain
MGENNLLELSKLDKMYFSYVKEFEVVDNCLQSQRTPHWEPLVEDIFASLYKVSPKIREIKQIPKSLSVNKTILDQLFDLKEWKQIRTKTVLDEFASAISLSNMIELLRIPEESEEQIRKLKQYEDQLEELSLMFQTLSESGKANSPLAQSIQSQYSQLKQEYDQMEVPSIDEGAIRTTIRKSIQETNEELDRIESMSFGHEPGQITQTSIEEKLKIVQKLRRNNKLKELSEKLGRYRRILSSIRKNKVRHSSGEITTLEFGNDLSRVLPVELVFLKRPELKKVFKRKFIENQLLLYGTKLPQPESKGPIYVLVDGSGSMEGAKEIWSKATVLALVQLAFEENREIVLSQFGSKPEFYSVGPIRKDTPNVTEMILDFSSFFFGGGTDFEMPLSKAKEYISNSKKNDIVFITDGECSISSQFQSDFSQWKQETKTKLATIIIRGYSNDQLVEISDLVLRVNSFNEDSDQVTMELFKAID